MSLENCFPLNESATSHAPACRAGVCSLIACGDTSSPQINIPPKITWSPSKKLSPIMTTVVPPVVGPSFGHTAFMTGMARVETVPSSWSMRLVRRPCLELLWTNMFSDAARKLGLLASTHIVCEMTTWKRRMSLGLPAFFKQFWLHFRKNLRKNLWYKIKLDYRGNKKNKINFYRLDLV